MNSPEETIGSAAGTVYDILNENGSMTEEEILHAAKELDPPLAYQGLGWLAREGKIAMEPNGQAQRTYALEECEKARQPSHESGCECGECG